MELSISGNKIMQGRGPAGSAAFLVGRLGTEAARRFAERLKPLGLTPPHAGVLRLLMHSPDANQRELALALGLHPPRLVLVLDEMEKLGLLTRADSTGDRRSNAIILTAKGRQTFAAVSEVGRAHSEELFAGLSPKNRKALVELLHKVAGNLGFPDSARPGKPEASKSKSGAGRKTRE
jgi:DNA-binding MarR family transcriptional regulator